jgi:hypothetical protein
VQIIEDESLYVIDLIGTRLSELENRILPNDRFTLSYVQNLAICEINISIGRGGAADIVSEI